MCTPDYDKYILIVLYLIDCSIKIKCDVPTFKITKIGADIVKSILGRKINNL